MKMIYVLPTDTCFGLACSIDDIKNYNNIYKIKKRSFDKPLAIMVDSFSWLEKNTTLTKEQIEFLKNYKKPFTILTNSNIIKMILNIQQEDFQYENHLVYEKIAFRVANNNIEKKLIDKIGPFFLTSANITGEKEIYHISEAKKQFEKYSKFIKFLGEGQKLDDSIKPSDLFEFVGESLKVKYLRKK